MASKARNHDEAAMIMEAYFARLAAENAAPPWEAALRRPPVRARRRLRGTRWPRVRAGRGRPVG
jgi:hypothetical protein